MEFIDTIHKECIFHSLGGGFTYFLYSPLFGEDSHFDYVIFFKWVETTNQCIHYMGVSENRGAPKWMVYNGTPY